LYAIAAGRRNLRRKQRSRRDAASEPHAGNARGSRLRLSAG